MLSSWSAAKDLMPENHSTIRSFAALQDDKVIMTLCVSAAPTCRPL